MDDLQNSRTSFFILNSHWFTQRTMLKQMGGCKSWENASTLERPLFSRIILQCQAWDYCYGRLFYIQHPASNSVVITVKARSRHNKKYHGKKDENCGEYCSTSNHSQILTTPEFMDALQSYQDQTFQRWQIIRLLIIRCLITGFILLAREKPS